MRVGDTILDTAAKTSIYENWWLLKINQRELYSSVENIYQTSDMPLMDNISISTAVTSTTKIGNLPEFSNPVGYNPKVISNTLSLV